MKTTEILQQTDIPKQKLYYLEQKGYIKPKHIQAGEHEAREYSDEDFVKIKTIWKYLQQGFRYKIAYLKAKEEIGDF